jgi:aminoglycoside phosphotransferase (APT) family kinase protein
MDQNRSEQIEADWIRHYTLRRICTALGLAPRLNRVEIPSRGRKSTLLMVWPETGPPMVVRRFKDPRLPRKLRRVHALLAEHDLPAPRLLYDAQSLLHWLRHGCAAMAETLIEGTLAFETEMKEPRLHALGETLALFHRIESPRWGEPGRLRTGPNFDGLIANKVAYRLDEIRRHEREGVGPSDADGRRILGFIESFRGRWGDGAPNVLCHGMLNPGNIVFTAGDRVVFIDWATMRYGPPGIDLAELLERFCADARSDAVLRDAYFAALPAEHRARFETFEPLFRVHCLLARWAAKERGIRKPRHAGRTGVAIERVRAALWNWIEKGRA